MNDNEINERSAEIKGEEIAAREFERQREESAEERSNTPSGGDLADIRNNIGDDEAPY